MQFADDRREKKETWEENWGEKEVNINKAVDLWVIW